MAFWEQPGFGGSAGGMLGQLGYSLFGGGKDPSQAAQPWMDQIPGTLKQYLDPYHQAGMRALPGLEKHYGQLMNDPTAMMNQIGRGYQQSPGYQYNVDQATRGANQAGAAGGMLGTPSEQLELAKQISGIASQDYGDYMNRGLGMYGMGLQGQQGLYNTGFGAGSSVAQGLSQALQNQAQMAYNSQKDKNQASKSMWGGLGSMAGGMFGAF